MNILDREISEGAPAFIVAEAACNHMCDIAFAKRMIDEAKNKGADAIKFQTYKAERLVTNSASTYWNYSTGTKSQFEYYKNLDKFDQKEYEELFQYAKQKGMIAFSTPFDVDSASMLNEVNAPLFKIASCDVLDTRLIKHVAKFGKPMIVSTGGSELQEIQKTVDLVLSTGNNQLVLMVCTLSYPAEDKDANLRRILEFKKYFSNIVIGYSDHTKPDAHMVIPSVAVSLGAKVIEKHFTLDKTMTGSGHAFSIDPHDLEKMVTNIRVTEAVLGEGTIKVYPAEEAARKNARRSLVASRNIQKGDMLTNEMISIKRPGIGLSADCIDQVLGKMVKNDIAKDEHILLQNLI